MKRRILLASGLTIGLACFATGSALAQSCPANLPVITPGKFTMSINATIPPKQYINAKGELSGLHKELGDELAKRLCLEPVFQNVSFEVQIPGLASKRWDMINSGLYYTAERAKIMQLVPYAVNALALITPANNPLGVKGPEDLAGHIVGVEIAGFEEKKLREINDAQVAKGLKPMDIRVFNNYGDTFLALGAKQIEAVFAGDATGRYYQERGQFTVAATGLFPGTPSAFAFANPVLAQAVADALNAMVKDGTYKKMMDAYGTTVIDGWPEWTGKFTFFHKPGT